MSYDIKSITVFLEKFVSQKEKKITADYRFRLNKLSSDFSMIFFFSKNVIVFLLSIHF